MFDLTDEAENSLPTTLKVKPAEVKEIPKEDKKKEKPTHTKEGVEIEYYDTKNGDDSKW